MVSRNEAPRRQPGGGQGWGSSGKTTTHPHSTTAAAPGQAVFGSNGRVVGYLRDRWLVKVGLDPAKHKLRQPSGWATDTSHLQIPGLVGIRLLTVNGETWEAPLSAWERYGIGLDRGFGRQVVLPDRFWTVTRPGERVGQQLAFAWGGGAP